MPESPDSHGGNGGADNYDGSEESDDRQPICESGISWFSQWPTDEQLRSVRTAAPAAELPSNFISQIRNCVVQGWFEMTEAHLQEWQGILTQDRDAERAAAPEWELVRGYGIHGVAEHPQEIQQGHDQTIDGTNFVHSSQLIDDGQEVIHHDGFDAYDARRERVARTNALITTDELVLYRYVNDADAEAIEYAALGKVVSLSEGADTTSQDTMIGVSWLVPVVKRTSRRADNTLDLTHCAFGEASNNCQRVVTEIPRGAVLASGLSLTKRGLLNTQSRREVKMRLMETRLTFEEFAQPPKRRRRGREPNEDVDSENEADESES